MEVAEANYVEKEVKKYIVVFVALAALTVITVAVSRFNLGITGNIIMALVIATVKASLVACYFMHLISEKKLIYSVLILTGVIFIALMFLPLSNSYEGLVGMEQIHAPAKAEKVTQIVH